ncbi:MAG: multiple sugar transport system substrate-binding protein [Gaiellales bacterium]|jgi:ABC-type glycerol-3-phosphate transport system substrate-binding protein|nr:multiple sugar transport system substrate-binding protein [Gaiellales bacterium]
MIRSRRLRIAVAALLVGAVSATTAVSAASAHRKAVVTLTFQSLAWQDPTVAANKSIVDAWNKANPNIQVKYVQGDWGSVHDQLLTSFVGGNAPDIIHDEAADIAGFTQQGYLADLSKLRSPELTSSIPQNIWDSVTFNKKITGVPFLLQTYNLFANSTMLKAAGIPLPTQAKPWTWAKFRAVAKQLTANGHYGVGWGLKSPTATILSTALNFEGKYFYTTGGKTSFKFGSAESKVPLFIHDMIWADHSIDPSSVSASGSSVLPGFFAGKYALTMQGSYAAQQMAQDAPAGFRWIMLPPLKSASQAQAADPQTLSISQQSKHKTEAMQFIGYFLNAKNMAKLALGDWLIPASPAAGKVVLQHNSNPGAWRIATSSLNALDVAPFESLGAYPKWKDQYATPAFQQYLQNQISLDDLNKKLTDGWNSVAAG